MYAVDEIDTVHLEPTNKCNAKCPMCARTESDGSTNRNLPISEISLTDIKKMISRKVILQLKKFYMCGNYGDPAMAAETLEIFEYIRSLNPTAHLSMFTNGSIRSKTWWQSIANIIDLCHFSIDGLRDTNHIYRIGTSFDSIINNITNFIESGGKACWDFIVFEHNEHQVEEARKFAYSIGVSQFVVKKTGRFFDTTSLKAKEEHNVNQNSKKLYTIKPPKNSKYQNKSINTKHIEKTFGSMGDYFNKTDISCRAQVEKSIYISSEGLVFPCCWTAGQMYPWYQKPNSTQISKIIDQLPDGKDHINLKARTLQEILESPFFTNQIPLRWEQGIDRLTICARMCGKSFDAFGGQFK